MDRQGLPKMDGPLTRAMSQLESVSTLYQETTQQRLPQKDSTKGTHEEQEQDKRLTDPQEART